MCLYNKLKRSLIKYIIIAAKAYYYLQAIMYKTQYYNNATEQRNFFATCIIVFLRYFQFKHSNILT